jgi:hypothetical protein
LSTNLEAVVGPPPAQALRLDQFETAEEFADALEEAVAGNNEVSVGLSPGKRPSPLDESPPTIPEVFDAVVAAAARHEACRVRVFVASEQVRARLLARLPSARADVLR